MLTHYVRDFNTQALGAGVTAFIWYAFGAVPLHIAVAGQLGLSLDQSSSWVFIVWFSGALSSIALSLCYRQPIPITWSIPGLIYLGTLAGQFTFAEMVGANVVAGVLILVLGVFGIGRRLMAWLPLPIVMGMFAGSIFSYATRMVEVTVNDLLVAGPTVSGYLVGRLVGNPRIPPVGLAVVFGLAAILIGEQTNEASLTWSLPSLSIPDASFSLSAVAAMSLPMVVLALGLGNVQGLGFLMSQGYKISVNPISIVVGINSLINPILGGHAATVARTGVAILAGPDAGPASTRYWANLIAASLTIVIALGAGLVMTLLAILPSSYVFALAGLAIFASLQGAFEQAFGTKLRFGALVAFVVAATPFAFMGITSAFWAVVVGMIASLVAERIDLLEHWAKQSDQERKGGAGPAFVV